jgi:hypothetical protein
MSRLTVVPAGADRFEVRTVPDRRDAGSYSMTLGCITGRGREWRPVTTTGQAPDRPFGKRKDAANWLDTAMTGTRYDDPVKD